MQRFRQKESSPPTQVSFAAPAVAPVHVKPVRLRRQRRKMNRAQRTLLGVFAGLPFGLAVLAYVSVVGYAQANSLSQEEDLAAIRRAGVGTDIESIRPKPIPDAENAAPIYRQAIAYAAEPANRPLINYIDRASSNHPDLFSDLQVRAAYPALAKEYALIEQAADHPGCDWDRRWADGPRLMFPEYSELKRFVRMLCFKAKFQAEAGDPEGALTSLARAKRISDHAGADPVLIAKLVQVACESIVLSSLESVAQTPTFGPAQLRKAADLVRGFGDLPDIRTSMGGEIIFMRLGLREIHTVGDVATIWESPSENRPIWAPIPVPESVKSAIAARYLSNMRPYIEQMPKDPNDWEGFVRASTAADSRIASDTSAFGWMAGIFVPVFSGTGTAIGRLQTSRRLALTTLALLEQRTKGQSPQIPPGEESIDPFSKRPFQLKKTDFGYDLWSVGPDRVDSGGRPAGGDYLSNNDDQTVEIVGP